MIKINATLSGGIVSPERPITEEEKSSVIATYITDTEYVYFQEGDQDSEEWTAYQLHINGDPLSNAKEEKIRAIDEKTSEIIARGFSFGGHQFSLSDNAQRNWIGIAAGLAIGLYTEQNFPFPLSDLSEQKYDLQWADRFAFLGNVSSIIGLNKTIGTGLKQQVLDASTVEEVNAVTDNRE